MLCPTVQLINMSANFDTHTGEVDREAGTVCVMHHAMEPRQRKLQEINKWKFQGVSIYWLW